MIVPHPSRLGSHIIDLGKTWEKLVLAAKIIVAIPNPQDVVVISGRPTGQRSVLKFCQYTGCQTVSGRYTPGTFTNQITKQFREPRLLIVTDPLVDKQVRPSPLQSPRRPSRRLPASIFPALLSAVPMPTSSASMLLFPATTRTRSPLV